MISQSLPLFALIATCLTLSIPLDFSVIRLPSQNATVLPLPANTTNTRLGAWPVAPFSRHLGRNTDIEVIKRTPSSPTDPTSDIGVLAGISSIGQKARSPGRPTLIQNFHEKSGPVNFRFHATEDPFQGSEVAKVLDALWELTNWYGKSGVYGSLVKVGVHTAFFELSLNKVAEAK